jgi:mono/diheme cytochrome c family protein
LGRGHLVAAGERAGRVPPGGAAQRRGRGSSPGAARAGAEVAGAALYVHYGCINCHGPNGLGGVPNPLSEDKVIPRFRARTSAASSTPTGSSRTPTSPRSSPTSRR